MTKLSRRDFAIIGAAALVCSRRSGAAGPMEIDPLQVPSSTDLEALNASMCLMERQGTDGAWVPSVSLLRSSDVLARVVRIVDGLWYLNKGERVRLLRRGVPIVIVHKTAERQADGIHAQ